jgi:hypothetical protein
MAAFESSFLRQADLDSSLNGSGSMHNFTLAIVIALVAGVGAALFSARRSRRHQP